MKLIVLLLCYLSRLVRLVATASVPAPIQLLKNITFLEPPPSIPVNM